MESRMPVAVFNNMTDGLAPAARNREHFLANLDLEEGPHWMPYAEGVWLQPACFNVTSGALTVLLKGMPGAQLGVHYHTGTVRGFTIQGNWRYLEHDWVAGPGSFIFEPAGEAHTLVVTEESPAPVLILFMIDGALIYLDKPVDGTMVALEDVFSALEMFRAYYRATGLDVSLLDAMIR
jgi:2,4'-dihydroxyacetophenone dioxygenase